MFVINITYTKSLEEVDRYLEGHIDYLNDQYEKGHFIASGRKVPRTGGVILSKLDNRNMLDEILGKDPFKISGVAEYEVIEFIPSMTAQGYDLLK